MMKVLVLGSGGQLGREVMRARRSAGLNLVGLDRASLDIADSLAVTAALDSIRPAVVINCATYTAVDRAESDAGNAFQVNARASGHLAKVCAARGMALVHISTDYVFDGSSDRPYVETDPTAPLGVYGRSKCEGEEAIRGVLDRHLILRPAWVYSVFGSNFMKTMLRLAGERPVIRVVNDQFGTPTAAADLADAIMKMTQAVTAGSGAFGTYHLTNHGFTTWYGFAEEIFADLQRRTGRQVELVPIGTADYPTPARQ